MVLQPLEFTDCLSDSPWFRQNLHEHEVVLDETHKNIKNIEMQCRELIQCTKKLSAAQRAFAKSLKEFKFTVVGNNQTDDERKIAECLSKFGDFVNQIEDHREKIVEDSETHYIDSLKKFRMEVIGRVLHEDKKRYEKESNKFYASLEKHLHLSTARRNDFKEADAQLDIQQRNFCKYSLDYVTSIQSVQERLKFEFVETLSSFLYSWLTFYHVGHVTHEDFKPFLGEVQSKVQKARQSFDETKECYEQLREKMLLNHLKNAVFQSRTQTGTDGNISNTPTSIKQGYVFVQEKSKLPKTIGRDVLSNRWTMYYCVYQKETRIFTMIPSNSYTKTDMRGALGQSVSFKVKSCTRRASDSIDKRFCFDVSAVDRAEALTLQALSEEDRRQWLDAMDGREPIYSPGAGPPRNSFETVLDETGFEFIEKCLEIIESKGITEQGIYRNCGVSSRVQKLLQTYLDKRRIGTKKINFLDESEWEIRTVSSAVKAYLRNLPEPLMTFDLHSNFINAAKLDSSLRVSHIHYFVHQLPKMHFAMLKMIILHLRRIADRSDENKMTVGNLGVCFGPTLLRPKEETMAAIMDIKFCNVVVEVLIANSDLIFQSSPKSIDIGVVPAKFTGHEGNSIDCSSFLSASASLVKQTSALFTDLDKNRSDRGCSLSARTGQKINISSPQRPRIYDRVAGSASLSVDEIHQSPLSRSMPPYSKQSLSVGESSYSVVKQVAPKAPTKKTVRTNIKDFDFGAPTKQQQKLNDEEFHQESSDSLNSQASGSDGSWSSTERRRFFHDSLQDRNVFSPYKSLSKSYGSVQNPTSEPRRVKTLYVCVAGHDTELSFEPGQIITNVYESKEEGWLVGTLNGKTGLIPANYVEPLP